MPAPVLLLDGASMWYRSFFGVPSSITAPDGRPVNAVRGFLDTLAALINRYSPARMVVCLDVDWRPQWRVDLIPSYKAHRVAQPEPDDRPDIEEVPDDLSPQADMIVDILAAFGIATGGAPGFEADDVLGTLATAERRDPVIVVSGDRDLLQVVAEEPVEVRVLYLSRGLAKATLFGPAEVAERFGLPVARAGAAYAELALLRGDPSDGLPGVRGIGEKKAAMLLMNYGSLAAVRAAVEDPGSSVPGATRAQLRAATGYLEAAEPVVRVVTDAPVTLSTPSDALPRVVRSGNQPTRAAELGARLGVGSSIARLDRALAGGPPA